MISSFLCPQVYDPEVALQIPKPLKNSKTRKSDSNVTFGVPVRVTRKQVNSDKMSLLSYFHRDPETHI